MTKTHDLSRKHPLYERWKGMRARCNNPGHEMYHRYGGRGIAVCKRWDDFTVFLADMWESWPGYGYEIHRFDEDGDYTPDNTCWISVAAHRSMPKSADHRAAIGAAHKGRTHTKEHTEAVAAAQRIKLDADWLRRAYVDRGLSVYQIADEAGCGKSSVHRALKREGIER